MAAIQKKRLKEHREEIKKSGRLSSTEQEELRILVITGFVASTHGGVPTTLRRNGSDFTASIMGKLFEADVVTIWTDVDGVLSAPPALVPAAASIPRLSYDEAAELSFFGAKVLHPQTVRPLSERGIPIRVRNTQVPERPGTEITSIGKPAYHGADRSMRSECVRYPARYSVTRRRP